MKKVIRKRSHRAKNGTTMWRLTTLNIRTGKSTIRTVRGTYDEVTATVHRVRSRNRYNAVCAEEMSKGGSKVKENGRVVALDSLEDEALFDEVIRDGTQRKINEDSREETPFSMPTNFDFLP